MMRLKFFLKLSGLLLFSLVSCDSRYSEKKVFGFLFNNQWDSLKVHIEDPGDDFEFIFNSGLQLKGNYDFNTEDSILIIRLGDKVMDSIRYLWNEASRKVQIDSNEVRKLFSHEMEIRELLVTYYIKHHQPRKAWQWLTYPDPLDIDSLYGDFFKDMHYAVTLGDYANAIPRIKRAWKEGHANSGLALSYWIIFQGDRDEGIEILKELASRQNTEAMVRLGEIYETYFADFGYDPPGDAQPESSFQWYKKAASLNNTFAMYQLGFIYERGINKAINMDSAFYWYRKSSDLGEGIASSAIATLYLEGYDIEQNIDSGMFWFKKAIAQDPSNGYLDLGEIYEKGLGIDVNYELALKCYIKADSAGSPVAWLAIKRLEDKGTKRN